MMSFVPTHLQMMKLQMLIMMRLPLIHLQMVEIMKKLTMMKGGKFKWNLEVNR